jgi:drug/metabolite transporter (DMT)-like permease
MTRRAWIAFAAMSLIWGVPYLLIRIAVRHGVTPATLAFGRVALAAVVLLALAWRAGTLRTLRGHWTALFAYAVAEVAIPFPAIAYGEQRLSSSLSAILISTMPLLIALLSLRINRSQRPTPTRAVGLVLGFGGVVALVGIDVAGKSSELVGAVAILIAAVGYTFGSTLINLRLTRLDPRATMGASLGIAAVMLAPYAAIDRPQGVPGAGAIASVVVLGLLCTAAAFVIFAVLIARASSPTSTRWSPSYSGSGYLASISGPARSPASCWSSRAPGWRPQGACPRAWIAYFRPPRRCASAGGPRSAAHRAPSYESLISAIVFSTNTIPNPIVQRLRLRSTSEPPPKGPLPVPTPKAPDSPASLPECIRIKKIRMTHTNTCRALSTGTMSEAMVAAQSPLSAPGKLAEAAVPRARSRRRRISIASKRSERSID